MAIPRRSRLVALGLGVAILATQGSATGHSIIDMTGVVLVDQRVVDGTRVEETYRATVRHRHLDAVRDAALLRARVWSQHPSIQVLDHELEFGTVGAGATAESRDTFTIRRHRWVPFRFSHLGWHLTWEPDILLGDPWTGEWNVTVQHFDLESGAIESRSRIVDTVRADELFGLTAIPEGVVCKGGRTSAGLMFLFLDGSTSTGDIVWYAWDFSWHTFTPPLASANPRMNLIIPQGFGVTITLTVTDRSGATASVTKGFPY